MLKKARKQIQSANFAMIDRKEIIDDNSLNYTEKWLLIIIVSFIRNDNSFEVTIPQEQILRVMECGISTLKRARSSLKKKGKIDYHYNTYTILFESDKKSFTKAYYSVLYNKGFTSQEKLTLVAMEHFIRQNGVRSFNKSLPNISQAMGYEKSSVSVVRNILKELKLKDYISFEKCKGGVSKGIGITYRFTLFDFSKLKFTDMTDTLDFEEKPFDLNKAFYESMEDKKRVKEIQHLFFKVFGKKLSNKQLFALYVLPSDFRLNEEFNLIKQRIGITNIHDLGNYVVTAIINNHCGIN